MLLQADTCSYRTPAIVDCMAFAHTLVCLNIGHQKRILRCVYGRTSVISSLLLYIFLEMNGIKLSIHVV